MPAEPNCGTRRSRRAATRAIRATSGVWAATRSSRTARNFRDRPCMGRCAVFVERGRQVLQGGPRLRHRCFPYGRGVGGCHGQSDQRPDLHRKRRDHLYRRFDVEWASQQTKTVADVQEKGHGEPELQNAKDATCTAEGYTGDRVCPDCGTVIEQGTATAKTAPYLSGRRVQHMRRRRPRL